MRFPIAYVFQIANASANCNFCCRSHRKVPDNHRHNRNLFCGAGKKNHVSAIAKTAIFLVLNSRDSEPKIWCEISLSAGFQGFSWRFWPLKNIHLYVVWSLYCMLYVHITSPAAWPSHWKYWSGRAHSSDRNVALWWKMFIWRRAEGVSIEGGRVPRPS